MKSQAYGEDLPVNLIIKLKEYFFQFKTLSITDQNLKGVTQKLGLPHPSELQNWNGRGGHNFWATPSKFCENSYFCKDL